MVAPGGSVFAISGSSVARSVDSGRTWTTLPVHSSVSESPYFRLGIGSDGTLFAINYARTERSTDNGTTWQTIATPAPFWDMITAANGDLLASSYQRLYISHDSGTTWENGSALLVASMTIGADGTLYAIESAIASPGIHRSTDNGASWVRASSRPADLIGVGRSGDVWIAAGDTLLVSSDRGSTWRTEMVAGDTPLVGAILQAPDGDLLVAASGTLYRSRDNGARWSLGSSVPAGYLVGIDSAGALYTFRQQTDWFPGGYERTSTTLFQSTDEGAEWHAIRGAGDLSAIDLTQPGMLAAGFTEHGPEGGTGGGASVSTDGGRSWDTTSLHLACDHVVATRNGRLLAGVFEGDELQRIPRLYSSNDSGATWEVRIDSLRTSVLTVASNGTIYLDGFKSGYDSTLGMPTERKVFLRSTDEGTSWENLLDSGWVTDLFVAPSGRLYSRIAYDDNTANWINVVSEDNGRSWTLLEPRYPDWIPRYLLELPGGDVIATYNDTLFRSSDNGRTWRSIQFDLPFDHIGHLIATRSGYLFVETVRGIYRASADAADVVERVPVRIRGMHLESPRPHPLGTTSTLPVVLAAPRSLRITLCDVLGRELRVIHDGILPAGASELKLERGDLPVGVYMVVARSVDGVESRMITIGSR
jgi:photosystem II stability/assembly factor-like uncharacterized protein